MQAGNSFFDKKVIIAFIIYSLLNGILLFKFGIQTTGEAEKYIDNANRILQGQELRNGVFSIFYFSYSVIVAFFIKFSIHLIFISVLQIALSFIAALCLYKVLLNNLENKLIAFFFFITYLLCYPVQKWNFFLYSEGVHTSFLVIGVYFFDKLIRQKKITQLIAFGIMMGAIMFSRPVGVIFLMAAVFVLINYFYRSKNYTFFYSFLFLSIIVIVGILNSPLTAFINPDSIRRMEVICQVPETAADIAYVEFNRSGLKNTFKVIKDDVGISSFFKSGVKKLSYFFGMYRSYYSWQHNLLLICYTIFYPFVLIGIFIRKGKSFHYIETLSIIYLLLTTVGIFFTCDEWSNRFISPAFPFILILAATGCSAIFTRITGNLSQSQK